MRTYGGWVMTTSLGPHYWLQCPCGHYSLRWADALTKAEGTFHCFECGRLNSLTPVQMEKLRKVNEFQRKEAAR